MRVLSFIILSWLQLSVFSQELKPLTDPWPVTTSSFIQGFDQPISGTEIDYFPFLEKGKIALYLGENGKHPSFSFKTPPVPEHQEKATFIWEAAIGKNTGERLATYRMKINGREFLTIHGYEEGQLKSWQYEKDGTTLYFIHTKTGKARGELFGYMVLELPVNKYPANQALEIQFEEDVSDVFDFFMVIQNPVRSSLQLFEEAAILKTPNGNKQSVRVELTHLGAPTPVQFKFENKLIKTTSISTGKNIIYLHFDPVKSTKTGQLSIELKGKVPIKKSITLEPVRHFEVYFLPHSHVDIGFTHTQDEVARLQWKNLDLALDLVDKTRNFPEGSQYKWNAEISWVLDGYLKQASEKQKQRLIQAVESGHIGVDALYGSVLTGLQREEELFHNTSFANELKDKYDFDIQTAMITDVPGYTWGTSTGLSQTGIKYLSVGPNHMPHLPHGGYQVGHTFEAWGDIPFYWVGPSKKDKILFWMSTHGYSWFHSWSVGNISNAGGTPILNFLEELKAQRYPYDIVQLRYNIGNDNGPPDPDMPGFFKEWNEKYEWPKFRIATTLEMMKAFESRYKDQIPEHSGDFTPYWEDGAASSATETAINRNTADRLVQAETLYALLDPDAFPAEVIDDAWTNVVLFSEHTWGAAESKSKPESEMTKSLWEVKKGFTLDAQQTAETSINEVLPSIEPSQPVKSIQIINTLSWARTDLVTLPASWNLTGYRIVEEDGKEIASQVLNSGELVFVATDIPAFGSKKFHLKKGKPRPTGSVQVERDKIENDRIRIQMDEQTGQIEQIFDKEMGIEFVNEDDTLGFNTYWYSGLIRENASKNHSPVFNISENGPLLSSILIKSQGEGAHTIEQEIRLISGMNRIEITNTVDKIKVIENENVRFSFPFEIENGQLSMDIPWGVMKPGVNQLQGANYNFFCAQRFLDISNDRYGVTLTTADAPIWEVGHMNGQLWMENMDIRPWFKSYRPSQTLLSWNMNNAWFVNYKAYQEGKISFRHRIIPHQQFSSAEAKKKGMEQTMPLIVTPALSDNKNIEAPFSISGSDEVIVTSFKPGDNEKSLLVRFFNSSDKANTIRLKWENRFGQRFLSSPLEETGAPMGDEINFDPWEIITVKVMRP